MGEQMETNVSEKTVVERMVRNLNRHQRRGVEVVRGQHLLSKEEKTRVAEQVIEDAIKNNMAEKVIDDFVGSLAALPITARLRFCFGILFNR
jgi:hypothetical protein